MPTTLADVERWLHEPEGIHLEFKEARRNFHFDTLCDYCAALANEGGGKIVLGVTDTRPRRVVGSLAFSEPGRTEAGLYEKFRRRIAVDEVQHPDGRVVIVHVPSRLPGTAWDIDGRYLKRAGDALVPMTHQELREIFAESGIDFSAEPCPGALLADLSVEAIAVFRQRWAAKARDPRIAAWTDEDVLVNAELLVPDGLTYAALILFGTRAALGRWLAQAEVVFEFRTSEAAGPAADREEYREGFFLWHDRLWNTIDLRNDRQSYQEGLFKLDLPTFDEAAVREALLNAVAHRDYRHAGSVFVRQYANRLEVTSPGGLPPGVTVDNILYQQNPRNRRLAEAFTRCGLIERSGQGVNLMFETAVRQGKPLPSFRGTTSHQVQVTLHGTVTSPAFVRFMERLGETRLRLFSTNDFIALDYIRREEEVPQSFQSSLARLSQAGAIEAAGRGRNRRFLLARGLYAALGKKGAYTRRKGLDRATNMALLLKHIEDNAGEGARMEEFLEVLPNLPRSQIQALLRGMRKEGRVHRIGVTRAARWYPGPDDV